MADLSTGELLLRVSSWTGRSRATPSLVGLLVFVWFQVTGLGALWPACIDHIFYTAKMRLLLMSARRL